MLRFAGILLCLLWAFPLLAQAPGNDDCPGIIDLGEIPICPVIGIFDNVDATGSVVFSDLSLNQPTCWNGSQPQADVWFSFDVPIGSPILDVAIEVIGVDGPNGSILQPQMAVYRGDCLLDEMEELACATSGAGETMVDLEIYGLDPGFSYFIRIEDWSATAGENWGDFELCLKEPEQVFNIGDTPGSGACSGTLYDSGGPDGSYMNNENHTFVICPDVPTNCINIDVVSTNIETNFDNLTFFQGDDLSGPLLWNFTGNGGAVSLQAGTDCITVLFDSDISVTAAGFELTWSCSPTPCATTLFPCEETQPIFGLPFSDLNQTSCGSGDDVQDGPCGDGTSVLAGEDVVYTYFTQGNECIQILASGVGANTGLSVYNDCPESANQCFAFAQNTVGDTVVIQNLALDSPGTIYIVLSNENCTDYDLQINQVPCLQITPPQPVCENAILLNSCQAPQDLFEISTIPSTNPDYFQVGVNDGCWSDLGAGHLTWLFFQAQTDGDFGMLVDVSDPMENPNIDIQVWGPITEFDQLCDFMAANQPARSTSAFANSENLTGLVDISPINGNTVLDVCEDTAGDGFVSTLPVVNGSYYLILLNDFSGNMQNGWLELDFSGTTPGVLDGLPFDTPLSSDPYQTVGTAFYEPQNGDYSCIQLTADANTQAGCAWQSELVDFSQPIITAVTVNFGDNDGGADGLCMVYHLDPNGASTCGINGGGIAAGGIQNSLIIEFDTWQNANNNDPFQDHISVNINGDMATPLIPPATLPNIEDGQDHDVVFTWDPSTMTYEVFFDGVLQQSGVFDVINNCFGGESMVWCGYTGSTGGASNLQYVCTGQAVLPSATLDTVRVELCEGESYFAGGAEQTNSGFYTDIYQAFSGCDSTIVTDLEFFPVYEETQEITLCQGESYFAGGEEQTTSGIYTDEYLSINGCDSTVVTDLTFLPVVFDALNIVLCDGVSYFAGGAEQTMDGLYYDTLTTINGCDSILATELTFLAIQAEIDPADPLTCENPDCVTLSATVTATLEDISISWSPSGTGAIDSDAETLMPNVCGPDIYILNVSIEEAGTVCADSTAVEVVAEYESDCLEYEIPNVFSPNGDGSNDVFEVLGDPAAFEITSFSIFNRWGELVHEGAGPTHAWDGFQNGKPAPSDVYAYVAIVRILLTGEERQEVGEITLMR